MCFTVSMTHFDINFTYSYNNYQICSKLIRNVNKLKPYIIC